MGEQVHEHLGGLRPSHGQRLPNFEGATVGLSWAPAGGYVDEGGFALSCHWFNVAGAAVAEVAFGKTNARPLARQKPNFEGADFA